VVADAYLRALLAPPGREQIEHELLSAVGRSMAEVAPPEARSSTDLTHEISSRANHLGLL